MMHLGVCFSGEPIEAAKAVLAQEPWSRWHVDPIASGATSLAVHSPDRPEEDFVVADARRVAKAFAEYPRDVDRVLHLLERIPFTIASFMTIHPDWETRTPPYDAPSFGGGHFPQGWACAFKGAGHDRLVSRRWLEYGPWRLVRGSGDLTLVQFHDLDADSETALRQARPGHEHMGITPEGGFIQSGYVYEYELDGLYEAPNRLLKIVVSGRDVSPREMLDAAAALKLQALGPQRPLERIAYVFLEPERARAHLDALWLHGLECWTIEAGNEVRLDADLTLERNPPEWVRRLGEP